MGRGRPGGVGWGGREARWGLVPDLKINVGLIGCEAGGAQACHTDALLQEAASGGHEAGQGQGDAQERGGAVPMVPEHACGGQRRMAPGRRDPPHPQPRPPVARTLPGTQLHGQHGRPLELLPCTLVPADGPIQLPLQVIQVLRPKTWGWETQWEGRSEVQGPPGGQGSGGVFWVRATHQEAQGCRNRVQSRGCGSRWRHPRR